MSKLVFEAKLVSYQYFMDELELYELELLYTNFAYGTKTQWETTRLISYYSLLPNLDRKYKNKKIEEVIPLITDKFDKEEVPVDHKGIQNVMELAKTVDINKLKTEDIQWEI